MKKLLPVLFTLLLLSQQQLHSLALQPLSVQSRLKKQYAAAEAYLYYRRDLQLLISDWGVDRELLIKFAMAKLRFDAATVTANDGRVFKFKTDISADGVFEVHLIDVAAGNAVSDVVFACDDTMAIDIELEEVMWEEADIEDMMKLGIGTKMAQIFFQDWFEFKGDQYVINVPTSHMIIERKPQNMLELYEEFEKTPIGKITKRCGVTKYIIKYIAKPSVRTYSVADEIVVTQENLADFIKWTTINETFIIEIDYRKVLTLQEARFLAHRYLSKTHPTLLQGVPQDVEDNLAVATAMMGINHHKVGEYELSCHLLNNGWVNIFLKKDGIESSLIAEILPKKLNIFLNDVSFGPTHIDLMRHNLGTQLATLLTNYVPVGFTSEVLVLNDVTMTMLAESRIQNMEDIHINFARTPIGKLFTRAGFGMFKYSFPTTVEYQNGTRLEVPLKITEANAKAFPAFIAAIKKFNLCATKLGNAEPMHEEIDLLPEIQRAMEGQMVGKYKLKTEINEDGGLYIYLTLGNVVDEQAALVVLPDLSTDIELQESSFGDLRGQGIGKKLFSLMGKPIPVGTEAPDLVVNKETVAAIAEAEINCMRDLNRVFSLTPVGKLHWAAGYNEYDFYFYDPSAGKEVLVTEENVKQLYKNVKARKNFNLVSKKTMTMQEMESYYAYVVGLTGCKYVGIQQGIADIEDMILLNLPSHTTVAIPRSEFSYEAVLAKAGLQKVSLVPKKTVDVELSGITGEVILRREDYLKIIRRQAANGFENARHVLKAG